MRYFLKMLCQLFNKDTMKITKARLEKARNANNQTRKKYNPNKTFVHLQNACVLFYREVIFLKNL